MEVGRGNGKKRERKGKIRERVKAKERGRKWGKNPKGKEGRIEGRGGGNTDKHQRLEKDGTS